MKTEDTITVALATTPGTATAMKVRASKRTRKSAEKKAAKSPKKRDAKTVSKKAARPVNREVRPDTKKAGVLELLRRKQGATTAEIAKATKWQNHSIRGFISGHVTKKMGLKVESSRNGEGERTYRIAK